jgi:hypothetical protein
MNETLFKSINMNISIGTAAWIAFRIWFLAVCFNAIAGTFYLTSFFTDTDDLGLIVGYGLFLGACYSFPIFIILSVVIYRCAKKQRTGARIFKTVLLSGILLTVLAFMVSGLYKEGILLSIGVIAGIGAIATQFKFLVELGTEPTTGNEYQL